MIKMMALGLLNILFDKRNEKGELPLDGSGRSRLVNMRVRRERGSGELRAKSTRNLITRLHSAGSPLPIIRHMTGRLKRRWLLNDPLYSIPSTLMSNPALAAGAVEVNLLGQPGALTK